MAVDGINTAEIVFVIEVTDCFTNYCQSTS